MSEQSAPLLPRIASGDRHSVELAMQRYGGLVWSLARRLAADPADAEDAVQEIFIDLWKSASRYDARVASESTFVAMIARRRLIDRKRARARRPEGEELQEWNAGSRDGIAEMERGADARTAAAILRELKPEQQRVLRLSIWQGLSHQEISTQTGMPLGTVKTYVRRGLEEIRQALLGRKEAAQA
jgi:RNA polymerase sigma-70 factor (ECF subfamily)